MYQYYKIDAIALKCTPQPVGGTYPPNAWAYLMGNEDLDIQYSAIPRLPAAKTIRSIRTQTLYFKRFGRQNDFNWYHNVGGTGPNNYPDFNIRIRFADLPAEPAWQFQLKYFVTFSMLIEKPTNRVDEAFDEIVTKPVINPEVIKAMNQQVKQHNDESLNLTISEVSAKTSISKPKPKQKVAKLKMPKHSRSKIKTMSQQAAEDEVKREEPPSEDIKLEESSLLSVSQISEEPQESSKLSNKEKRIKKKIAKAEVYVLSLLQDPEYLATPTDKKTLYIQTMVDKLKGQEENKYIVQALEKEKGKLQTRILKQVVAGELFKKQQ
jgi:hypothetical protein